MRRNMLRSALISAGLLMAGTAAAQTQVPEQPRISAAEAQDLARANGMDAVRSVQLYQEYWEIDGYDAAGREIRLDVDALTGAVIQR